MLCLLAAGLSRADETLESPLARFTVSSSHGNVVAGAAAIPVLGECLDLYLWRDDGGETRSSEADDQVTAARRDGDAWLFTCHNEKLGEAISKRYELTAGGLALAKTVTVGPLSRRGELHVRTVVALAPAYREGASYYSARQSWPAGSPERDLFGVQPAAEFATEVVSGAGWDNRFVVAFKSGAPALGHYRWAVRGQHVMPSTVIGAWGAQSAQALTYTPVGWHFQLQHTLDGEKAPVAATAHYLLCAGDVLDVWRHYRALPEQRAWEERPLPGWVSECKAGGFWHLSPGQDQAQIDAAHATAKRLDGKYLPLGVFAWSLDGDYETERPFVNEPGTLILTPEYMQSRVAAFQAEPHVRLGLYFQGSILESLTTAVRKHPEWTLQTRDGKPFSSGFRDNAAGDMPFLNPLDTAFCDHYRTRLQAVCKRYEPGWIYCDGGVAIETTDYRLRRPLLPDTWNRFYETQQTTVKASGPERAVLLNAQCWPYGDLYWLECSYFGAAAPWRDAIEFCFDTKVLHTPQRTMLPLYWNDETRYLALCIAFGFTPCTSGTVGGWDERVWRALDCAYAMRGAELVLSSRAVAPVWWRPETPAAERAVVCFAQRVGAALVVPVLNFGTTERVRVTVDRAETGLGRDLSAWLVHPFDTGADEALGPQPAGAGKLAFDLVLPTGFAGLRLLVLGAQPLL